MARQSDIRRWHTRRRPETIASVLDEMIEQGDPLGKSRWLVRILRAWPEVVGEDNARSHQPERFFLKDGILTVASRSAVHAAALQPYLEEIRTRLNRLFGRTVVKEIRTKQSSAMFRKPRGRTGK